MDNIWIVLLIVGAVISLTQKNRKQHPHQDPEDEDPARELRKQFEEMFGSRGEQPSAPHPTATPLPTPKAAPAKTDAIPQTTASPYPVTETTVSPRPSKLSEEHRRITTDRPVRDTSHRNESMTQEPARRLLQTKKNDVSPQRHAAAEVAAAHRNDSELERIIEEFDMERAVIYSEILKPKYEEY